MGDLPASSGQQEPAGTLDLLGEQVGVGAADLVAAVEDGELGWGSEDCRQVHEMAVPVAVFGLRADEQKARVLVEVAVFHQMPDDG